jgi:hypothetical protein
MERNTKWKSLKLDPFLGPFWVFADNVMGLGCRPMDEGTQMNIMTESTWETLGRPVMVPSLGKLGLFKGKMVTLCGRITRIAMSTHGAWTKEEFKVIKFIEDYAPFPTLLGKI